MIVRNGRDIAGSAENDEDDESYTHSSRVHSLVTFQEKKEEKKRKEVTNQV
jgi:hypothetical protein